MTAVDGYLLDTSALSDLHNPGSPRRTAVKMFLDGLAPTDMVFVSAVAIAEIEYGAALFEAAEGYASPRAANTLACARSYTIRDITRHTGTEYASIKANVAVKYLKDFRDKRYRTPWTEDWIDKYTGRALGINEGDLWMCAQARERNLVLVTTNKKMRRISVADSSVQLKVIE